MGVGGKEGNVVTKSNVNSIHRGWRIVAIAGQRVNAKDVASVLATAQKRPRFTVTFRIGDPKDDDDDTDHQAALFEEARRKAEEERLRLEMEEATRRKREAEDAEARQRSAEAKRKQKELEDAER